MLRSYFKTAFRNLLKRKGFTAINVAGLAIGMASAMIILLWIQHETGYDRFYPKIDRLYQVWNRDVYDGKLQCWDNTQKILAPTLKAEYPEVEDACRINWNQNLLFAYGDKRLKEEGTMTDPGFLTMFDFPMVKGNIKTALNNPQSIIITESFAKKLFGTEDPMNKTVKVDNLDNFLVTGILKDLPNNSSFSFHYVMPWSYMIKRGWSDSSWKNNSTNTYVLLKPNVSTETANAHIKDITIQHSRFESKTEVFLYPMSRKRLYTRFEDGKPSGGRISSVRIIAIIASFILLIACINFMNLSTARSEKRAKEVGIRKVAGAEKSSLIAQFLIESILIALIAGILAVLIVQLCLPAFNQLTQKQLKIEWGNIYFWISTLIFILFTGVLAGSYPAFFLSSFQPIAVLKRTFKKPYALVTPRKILVILQFTFAIILIICTIIIQKQIKYAQDREPGYSRNNLAYIFLEGDIQKNYELIKNELLNSGVATGISKSSHPLTENWSDTWSVHWQGKDEGSKTVINLFCTDGNLVKTAGMKIIQGRDIDVKNYISDSTAVVINEAALKLMKFKNPIGQIINNNKIDWHIVGVIQDFILQSPYEPIRPMVIQGPKGWFNVIHLKYNDKNSIAQNLAKAELIFKKYNPEYPFRSEFVDEQYARKFSDEQQIRTLSMLFGGLTIFISCLGLFGLASYMAENRIREIGIRKVLGASVSSITTLLSKDFIKLVCIAIIIGTPIAWIAMSKWLADFQYRTNISWWIFLLAGLLSILIALFTVSFQAIRAALSNPAISLKTE